MTSAVAAVRWSFAVFLSVIFLLGSIAHGQSLQCYDCHGDNGAPPDYRPIDAPGRDISTGGFQGNHRTHMAAPGSPQACTPCHPGSDSYTNSHRNGQIELSPGINASPLAAVYRNGSTSFTQKSQPRLGSCSSVNCHFERQTPVWGSAPLDAASGCGSCHGAPPSGGDTGAAGSHGRHAAIYTGINGCAVCHTDHLAEGNPFSHATSAGRRPIALRLPGGQGSYDGPLNDFLPKSQSNQFGSCSNVYCHDDGTYVGTGTNRSGTPAWGSNNPCTACHGNPPAYDSGSPKANSHQKHLFTCNRCHYATTTTGTTITTSYNHRNESYEVSGPPGETLSYGGVRQCYNSYCHGNGTNVATGGAANSSTSPSWGNSASLPCTSCHAYPPAYSKGAPKSNLHLLHNSYGYSCNRCHYATTQNGTTIAAGSTSHANRAYDLSGPPGQLFSYTYASTGGTCANGYCHSSVQGKANPADPPVYASPNWSQRYTVRCSRCHKRGYHVGDSYLMDTGSHLKHLKFDSTTHTCRMCHYTAKYGSAGIVCNECHNPGTTQIGSNLFTDFSPRGPEHADGVINVAIHPGFPASGATGSYSGDTMPGTAYGVCTNLYCHSQGTRATPPYALGNISTVTWGGTPMPADCTGCHNGDRNSSQPLATLSHGKHAGYDCSRCHAWTVYNSRSAIPIRQYSDNYPLYTTGSYHSNGYVEVMFSNRSAAVGGTYAGVANGTGRLAGTTPGRCTNVYCHSNGTAVVTRASYTNISTPVWGSSGRLNCGSCHGNPPAYPDGSPKANGHPKHSTDCRLCHYQTTANGSTISDRSKHAQYRYVVDSAPGVTFSYTYAAAGSSCSGVSCHTAGTTPRTWGATSCGNCHLAAPSDTSHKKHYSGIDRYAAYGNISSNQVFGYNCGVCHPLDPARDHDGTVQVELYNPAAPAGTVKAFNSILARYSSGATVLQDSRGVSYTNGTCSNIYCHSNGTSTGSARQPTSNGVTWNGGSLWCANCHNYPPNYGNGTPKPNSHQRHYYVGYNCKDCHYSVTTTSNSITDKAKHVNNTYDLAPGPGRSFNFTFNATSGSSCSLISCHSDGTGIATGTLRNKAQSTPWGGAAQTCSSCHSYPPNYDNGSPKANSHGAHSAYSCSRCHSYAVSSDGLYTDSYYHLNGQYNVNGTSLNYTYKSTGGTCTNSCHRYEATWGGPATDCTSCHGNPPWTMDAYSNPNVHERHKDPLTQLPYSCDYCHYSVTTNGTSIADRAKHANGIKDVAPNGSLFSSYSSGSVAGTCDNVSCHATGRKNVRWKYARPVYTWSDPENVPITGYTIAFGEDMIWSSINSDTFSITGVAGEVVTDPVQKTATFIPSQPFNYYTVYTLNVTDGIQNAAGDRVASSRSWEFTTQKGPAFRSITTETFGTVANPAATLVSLSCQSTPCWSINSTGYNPFTVPAVADPFATVSTSSSTTDSSLVSVPVDLTSYQSAELKFQIFISSYYTMWGYVYPDVDLEVSSNGANGPWTKVWSKLYYNTYSYPMDHYYTANITNIAAGRSNVLFRFRFYNTPSGTGTGCSVDNIILSGDPL